jgi:hypothetical protein
LGKLLAGRVENLELECPNCGVRLGWKRESHAQFGGREMPTFKEGVLHLTWCLSWHQLMSSVGIYALLCDMGKELHNGETPILKLWSVSISRPNYGPL